MRKITRIALATLALAVAVVGIAPHFVSGADARASYCAPKPC